ncbi:DUF5063 domain-containing protein [Niabella ginsengisoli]|uniref:DUF5063 domain-containing protein n=1 Tax=Niabella ginsengisoli TaxID=522298 RepID=A0ABS9SGE5_9BACT|nr:DUF5063 domain-containing protein [Niabella ginsengisoli]MCH5597400.1 DUF5063 domain-containing protein [Niabella ginsengisoli]
MTIHETIQANSFVAFINSARDFCNFIETDKTENHISFLQQTQHHLHTLYFGGQNLQFVDLSFNLDFPDIMTKVQVEIVLNRLANKLTNRFYCHVFDPTKEGNIETVCGDLLDDLGDIYIDLKNALLLFDKGTPAEIECAVWSFKFDFDSHWGNHCINATYALHYFIKGSI